MLSWLPQRVFRRMEYAACTNVLRKGTCMAIIKQEMPTTVVVGGLVFKNVKISAEGDYTFITRPDSYPREPILRFTTTNVDDDAYAGFLELCRSARAKWKKAVTSLFIPWLVTRGYIKKARDIRLRFVRKWGCPCGCSPGWRIRGLPKACNATVFRFNYSVSKAQEIK